MKLTETLSALIQSELKRQAKNLSQIAKNYDLNYKELYSWIYYGIPAHKQSRRYMIVLEQELGITLQNPDTHLEGRLS